MIDVRASAKLAIGWTRGDLSIKLGGLPRLLRDDEPRVAGYVHMRLPCSWSFFGVA